MEAIYGLTFRRPMHQEPLWLRILLGALSALFMIFIALSVLNFGRRVWSFFLLLPEPRQVLAGRILACLLGLTKIGASCHFWRRVLYLDPPMRELAATPASPGQILRLALRVRWFSPQNYNILLYCLLLYPWFEQTGLQFLPVPAWPWLMPLSAVLALAFSLLCEVIMRAVALALTLFAAATGCGGASPRAAFSGWPFLVFKTVVFLSIPALAVFTLLSVLVANPPPVLAQSLNWRVGKAIAAELENPNGLTRLLFQMFPSVGWFDALNTIFRGPVEVYMHGMAVCIGWLCLSGLLCAAFMRRGLGMEARAAWQDDFHAPKPADSIKIRKRQYDPDGINGPLEAWLVARFGRMGRATLRMNSAVFEAGSVDKHLLGVLKLIPLCLAGGFISMALAPKIIGMICLMFEGKLPWEAIEPIRILVAVLCILLTFMARMRVWGGLRLSAARQQRDASTGRMPRESAFNELSVLMVRDSTSTVTRGDNRHPLTEIYPMGFSDAVLLPTFYCLFWLAVLGGLLFLEGYVLGLPIWIVGWCVLIGVPAMTQVCFFAAIGNFLGNLQDYRRSRVISFFKLVTTITLSSLTAAILGALIVYLCLESIKSDRPWVAWLGTLNIMAVFDVAFYMLMRWIYVRRRFDAERRLQRSLF